MVLVISQMQIKTLVRYHYVAIERLEFFKLMEKNQKMYKGIKTSYKPE